MSQEKILQAISECDSYISGKTRMSAELSLDVAAAWLDWHIKHRANLVKMLNN